MTSPQMLEGLELSETEDGLVVYDASSDRVHCLNHTAAVILALCDGSRDGASIADLLAVEFDLRAPPTAEVRACLEQLEREGLIIAPAKEGRADHWIVDRSQ